MLAFKWSLAVPERSEDVPRSCRAGIIDFLMVFGGLGGGEATARAWAGHADQVRSDPLKQVFQDKPNTRISGTGTSTGTGTGHGQAQTQGQGQGHRASGQDHPLTPSRKARWRIRRPTRDERAKQRHQFLCSTSKVSLSKVFVHVSSNLSIILPGGSYWTRPRPLGTPLGRKRSPSKTSSNNFQNMFFFLVRKTLIFENPRCP